MRPHTRHRARLWALVAFVACLVLSGHARAEDRLTVRGQYYREDSTRVLQPLISFSKDLPDERVTVGVDYLMDVISSASIAAAAGALGGDMVFTEMRHEATFRVGSQLGPWGFGSFFRYSNETDYSSRALGFSFSRELRQRTITLSGAYSYTNDRHFRILPNVPGARSPWKSKVFNDGGAYVDGPSNLVQVHYGNLGYTHVLTRKLLASLQVEGSVGTGPQENAYRTVGNDTPEVHPLLRQRVAASGSLYYFIPRARLTLEPHYRFYADDWDIQAHKAEARVHVRVAKHLRLRARYRYYLQSEAFFFQRDQGAYAPTDRYRTADPKMGDYDSHTVGIQVTWHLDGLARFRRLEWLDGAYLQATYNHLFVDVDEYRFGNARIGSLAYSMSF